MFCIFLFLWCSKEIVLTDRLFMDLVSKVGLFGQAVQVSLQDVPAHLVVKWEAEFGMNLRRGKRNLYLHKLRLAIHW